MPELAAFRASARALWREVRSDARPVIAPYPERGPAPSWKWDRPVDLLVGRALAGARPAMLARAEAIAEAAEAFRRADALAPGNPGYRFKAIAAAGRA